MFGASRSSHAVCLSKARCRMYASAPHNLQVNGMFCLPLPLPSLQWRHFSSRHFGQRLLCFPGLTCTVVLCGGLFSYLYGCLSVYHTYQPFSLVHEKPFLWGLKSTEACRDLKKSIAVNAFIPLCFYTAGSYYTETLLNISKIYSRRRDACVNISTFWYNICI